MLDQDKETDAILVLSLSHHSVVIHRRGSGSNQYSSFSNIYLPTKGNFDLLAG